MAVVETAIASQRRGLELDAEAARRRGDGRAGDAVDRERPPRRHSSVGLAPPATANPRRGAEELVAAPATDELFRAAFDDAPNGMAVVTVDGRLVRANEALCELLDYGAPELAQASLAGLVHPDDLPDARAATQHLLARQCARWTGDMRLVTRDGLSVFARLSASLVGGADGAPPHLLFHVEDVGARRRAEEALRVATQRNRRSFEAASDGILVLDAVSGRVLDVNPRLAELLEHAPDDLVGKRVWELAAFKGAFGTEDEFNELAANSRARFDYLSLRRRGGRRIRVTLRSHAYVAEGTRVIRCDVRDRSDCEPSWVRATLERGLARASVAVVLADADGIVRYANPAFETLYGYDAGHVVGTSIDGANHGSNGPTDLPALAAALLSEPLGTRAITCCARDGTPRRVEASTTRIVGERGEELGILGIQRDITARSRAAEERATSEELLRASLKMESLGRLAGGIAHDFNNLLTVILSYVRFALEDLPEGDPLRDELREVQSAGRRATTLVGQLLAFSRSEEPKPVPLDVNRVVADMVRMLRRVIGEDITLQPVLALDAGVVVADRGQLEQVLMNLVVNARDAMPEGGTLTIATSCVELGEDEAKESPGLPAGQHVVLSVTDTGCGMSAHTKAHLFEPFFTTKPGAKGTGLGLATVQGIVEQCGGVIRVESEPGSGTTAAVFLPRQMETPAPSSDPHTPRVHARGSETILVVEDEDLVRQLVERILGGAGYEVLAAANADEALRVLDRHPGAIHLVLTDVVMPLMGGRAFAQHVATVRPESRIVYMSGYPDESIVHQDGLGRGSHFVAKPFGANELLVELRAVLDD